MNRILVVEDQELVLDVILQMIERMGFKPIGANNFEDALKLFQENRPGLLLSDINLGTNSLDGCELCSRIKDIDPTIIAISMSGYFTDLDKENVLGVGFSDFLIKPVNMNSLSLSLKCAFNRRNRWLEINDF
jgi:DNA-binding NtrC family response regulator